MSTVPTAPPPTRKGLSIEETAESLGLSTAHVRRLIWKGQLHAVRFGRRWVVPLSSLDAFLTGEPAA